MTTRIDGVWECRQRPDVLVDWLEGRLQGLSGVESLQRPAPTTLNLTSVYRPGWAIAVAILLFPIGLLALGAKARTTARVSAESAGTGSRVRLDGVVANEAARRLNECYAQLQQPAA